MGAGCDWFNPAGSRLLVRWLGGGKKIPDRAGGEARGAHPAGPQEVAPVLLPPLQSQRRRPGGALHLCLHPPGEGGRADQQLDGAEGDAAKAPRHAGGRDEGPDPFCDSLPDGAAGFAVGQGGRGADGLHLRGSEHADHDPDGEGGVGPFGGYGPLQPGHPFGVGLQS